MALAAALLALAGCGTERPAAKRPRDHNPPSIGFIDMPATGATVTVPVRVSGWALDESGVKAVRIYFDGDLVAVAPLVTPRPDVIAKYPAYRSHGDVVGFESLIDSGAHSGYTLIRAEAVDLKGAISQIYSVSVNIR